MEQPKLFDDFEFIRSFCPRFVPCQVQLDSPKNKHKKVPAISGWTSITPEQSQEIISRQEYAGHKYFIFLTGDGTGLFVVDIDRKDGSRPDHADKIDGVEAFEMWCGPIDNPDTFTSRSIGGGYHKVYKLTNELANNIKNGRLVPNVLCEILYNGRGFMYGEGCKIIHKMLPQPPPNAVVNMILNNCFNNNNVTNVNNTTINQFREAIPSSDAINSVLSCDVSWKINKEDDAYRLVPDTRQCCVDSTSMHTDNGHSCIYVGRTSVVLNCFSHGKRLLSGELSKSIRSLFYEYKNAQQSGVLEMVEKILAIASDELLARERGAVFKRISRLVPVYEHVDTYENFITSRLINSDHLKAHPKKYNDLMVYMAKVDDVKFPFIKRDKKYIGFSNGMLNIVSGELEYYGNLPNGVSPRHYIDQACMFDDLETPLFDRIFRYQLDTEDKEESDTVYMYMLGLIGRLFYDVGDFDNFDVMPFIVGDTNTGKSTLIDIVSAMFAPSSVGVIDSSHETIFGLQSMHSKEVIVSPEIPENMAHHLSSDKFKKMICGEIVAVPIKHSVAENIRWKVPMVMCGNDYPRYSDERGSISKRLAIFSFTRYVNTQDSSLKHRIINEELSKLVVKCLRAYRSLLHRTGTGGFWNMCPNYFKDNISSMHETTDYVHMFLTLGHGDNIWYDKVHNCKKIMYFVQQNPSVASAAGCTMWMEDFKKRFYDYMRFKHPTVRYKWTKDYSTFKRLGSLRYLSFSSNYMRFRHPGVKHKWTSDYSAFKRLGYNIEYINICKGCGATAKVGCCNEYNFANRSKRYIVKDLACIERYSANDYEWTE